MKIFWIIRDQQLSFIGLSNIIGSRYSWDIVGFWTLLMWFCLKQCGIYPNLIYQACSSGEGVTVMINQWMEWGTQTKSLKERQVTSNDKICYMNRLMFQSQGFGKTHTPVLLTLPQWYYMILRAGEVVVPQCGSPTTSQVLGTLYQFSAIKRLDKLADDRWDQSDCPWHEVPDWTSVAVACGLNVADFWCQKVCTFWVFYCFLKLGTHGAGVASLHDMFLGYWCPHVLIM